MHTYVALRSLNREGAVAGEKINQAKKKQKTKEKIVQINTNFKISLFSDVSFSTCSANMMENILADILRYISPARFTLVNHSQLQYLGPFLFKMHLPVIFSH